MKKRLIIVFSCFLCALQAYSVKVVFRLDDPDVQSQEEHAEILSLFVERQIPLSVALIPCDENEIPFAVADSNYLHLLNASNIEICMHGLTHTYAGTRGEFGGLSQAEANRRIEKGKEIVEQLFHKSPITFIPPHNAFDETTIEALSANGFYILSADVFQHVPCRDDMQYYPETLGHLMDTKGIWRAARESIAGSSEKDAVCVIMFHIYDLTTDEDWALLKNLLDYCTSVDDVELHTFASLYESSEQADWMRYRANQLSSGLSKKLLSEGVYHPTWACLWVHIANAIIYMLIAIIGFIIMAYVLKEKKRRYLLLGLTIGLLIFCMALLNVMSPMKLLFLVLLINTIPVICFCWIKVKTIVKPIKK